MISGWREKIPTGSGSRLKQGQKRFIRLKTGCRGSIPLCRLSHTAESRVPSHRCACCPTAHAAAGPHGTVTFDTAENFLPDALQRSQQRHGVTSWRINAVLKISPPQEIKLLTNTKTDTHTHKHTHTESLLFAVPPPVPGQNAIPSSGLSC